ERLVPEPVVVEDREATAGAHERAGLVGVHGLHRMEREDAVVGSDLVPIQDSDRLDASGAELGPRDLEELGAALPGGVVDVEGLGTSVACAEDQCEDDPSKREKTRRKTGWTRACGYGATSQIEEAV